MVPARDLNPTKRFPIVTMLLIAVNVVVYLAVQPHGATHESDSFVYHHALIPCEVVHGHPLSDSQIALQRCAVPGGSIVVRTPQGLERVPAQPFAPGKNVYAAIIASMFLHASLWHLFGNMLFFWIFGNNVEDHLGSLGYTLFYFAAGIVAALAYIAVSASSVAPLVGASGAIAGVMGAYLIWFPRARILSLFVFIPLYLPASLVLGIWFVTQFFTDPNSSVAWVAHVAGFAFGMVVAFALRNTKGPSTRIVPPPPELPGSWPGGLRGFE